MSARFTAVMTRKDVAAGTVEKRQCGMCFFLAPQYTDPDGLMDNVDRAAAASDWIGFVLTAPGGVGRLAPEALGFSAWGF